MVDEIALTERRGEPTRCPFCLDRVLLADERRCDACGAPHHAACLAERGACAACQRGRPGRPPEPVGPAPGRLLADAGPDALRVQLPRPPLAALGPPLGLGLFAVWLMGCIAALVVTVADPESIWVLALLLLVGPNGVQVGLALVARAVGHERVVVDGKHLLLERRALGRFGETIAMPLEDITSIRRSFGGRVRVEMAAGGHSFGRGLTDPEAAWLADALSARLPR